MILTVYTSQNSNQSGQLGQDLGSTYVVQRGDSLSSIARRFGITASQLQSQNNISNPNALRIGQILNVGRGSSSTNNSTNVVPTSSQFDLSQSCVYVLDATTTGVTSWNANSLKNAFEQQGWIINSISQDSPLFLFGFKFQIVATVSNQYANDNLVLTNARNIITQNNNRLDSLVISQKSCGSRSSTVTTNTTPGGYISSHSTVPASNQNMPVGQVQPAPGYTLADLQNSITSALSGLTNAAGNAATSGANAAGNAVKDASGGFLTGLGISTPFALIGVGVLAIILLRR